MPNTEKKAELELKISRRIRTLNRAELKLKILRRIRTFKRTEAKLKKAKKGVTSRILAVRNDAKKRRDSLNAASLGIFSLASFLQKKV